MTASLRKIRMPRQGIVDESGGINKAGHHYLAELEKVPGAVADIQDQITAVGSIGALAGLNSLDRAHLATGFGMVEIADTELGSLTTLGTYSTVVPYDDTIPQITEGDPVFSGTYTPVSDSSLIRLRFQGVVGVDAGSSRAAAICVFQGSGTDAIGVSLILLSAAFHAPVFFDTWVSSPGAGVATTFSLRIGPNAGAAYLNGANGIRFMGGSLRASFRLAEFEAH